MAIRTARWKATWPSAPPSTACWAAPNAQASRQRQACWHATRRTARRRRPPCRPASTSRDERLVPACQVAQLLRALPRKSYQFRQRGRGQVVQAVVSAEGAGNLEAILAVFGQRPQRRLGQVHDFRHIPVVQEILVIRQRVVGGA